MWPVNVNISPKISEVNFILNPFEAKVPILIPPGNYRKPFWCSGVFIRVSNRKIGYQLIADEWLENSRIFIEFLLFEFLICTGKFAIPASYRESCDLLFLEKKP